MPKSFVKEDGKKKTAKKMQRLGAVSCVETGNCKSKKKDEPRFISVRFFFLIGHEIAVLPQMSPRVNANANTNRRNCRFRIHGEWTSIT